jgi:hypothetical protein
MIRDLRLQVHKKIDYGFPYFLSIKHDLVFKKLPHRCNAAFADALRAP